MNHEFTETENCGRGLIWGEQSVFRFLQVTQEMPIERWTGRQTQAYGNGGPGLGWRGAVGSLRLDHGVT